MIITKFNQFTGKEEETGKKRSIQSIYPSRWEQQQQQEEEEREKDQHEMKKTSKSITTQRTIELSPLPCRGTSSRPFPFSNQLINHLGGSIDIHIKKWFVVCLFVCGGYVTICFVQ